MVKFLMLAASHVLVLAVGFAAGIYMLPILIAPDGPSEDEVRTLSRSAAYTGTFRRDLKGSDALHWGEGEIAVGPAAVSLMGRLAPGPDYKLYLSPEFVETGEDFFRVKADSVRLGDVRTFQNFVVPVPDRVDVSGYNTVVVWCETFSQFITAAKYR